MNKNTTFGAVLLDALTIHKLAGDTTEPSALGWVTSDRDPKRLRSAAGGLLTKAGWLAKVTGSEPDKVRVRLDDFDSDGVRNTQITLTALNGNPLAIAIPEGFKGGARVALSEADLDVQGFGDWNATKMATKAAIKAKTEKASPAS